MLFRSKEDIEKIAKQLYKNGSYTVLSDIAWAVSRKTLEELAKTMADKGEYNALMGVVPYLSDK